MPFQYSDSEYIKLNRKILNWEWYDDVNTRLLFIHCLLRANWMETSWHGVKLKRGEFITSLASLAEETNLSVRNVRTALKHLKATGEVTSRKYAKFRIISIKNWDLYQQSDKQSDKQVTSNRQASDKQVTTDIRTKELKEQEEAKKKDDDAPIIPRFLEAWDGLGYLASVSMTESRKAKLFSLVNQHGEDAVIAAVERIGRSDYLLGRDGSQPIRIDWMLQPDNFVKVMEGNYDSANQLPEGYEKGVRDLDY